MRWMKTANLLGIASAFGFAIAYGIGPISGCHVNPAVSFGVFAAGRSGQSPFSEIGALDDASTRATRSRFAIRRVSRATSSPASSSVKSRSTS